MIASIYSTNTIEGGELSYEETEDVLKLSDNEIKEQRDIQVGNLKKAYDFSEEMAGAIFRAYQEEQANAGEISLPDDVLLNLSEGLFSCHRCFYV